MSDRHLEWTVVARRAASNGIRALWHSLPLSSSAKRKLKDNIFRNLSYVLRWTKSYQAWDSFNLLDDGIVQPSSLIPVDDGIVQPSSLIPDWQPSSLIPDWDGDWEALIPIPTGAPDGVLVVDWKPPTPDCDSGSYRMNKILDCLAETGRPLYFIGAQDAHNPAYLQSVWDKGIVTAIGRQQAVTLLMSCGAQLGTVILSRPEVTERYLPLVRALAVRARVLYDTVDLHWVRLERGAEIAADNAAMTTAAAHYKALELANIAATDATIAITADEKDMVLAELPAATVHVLPNIHDITADVPPFEQRSGLFFIGSFEHAPNGEAVDYLVSEIMPRVSREIPDISLTIVGSSMPDTIKQLASDNLKPLGYVADIAPCFESARLFVAPLLHGAGMKGKVGQALSYGLPVVTTPVGAEGIGLSDGENVLIANDPDQFATQILRAYRDPELWSRLSSAGRAHIDRHFSSEVVKHSVLDLIAL